MTAHPESTSCGPEGPPSEVGLLPEIRITTATLATNASADRISVFISPMPTIPFSPQPRLHTLSF
jgi:hypothetical protein